MEQYLNQLADAWWKLGESCKTEERDSLLLRAGYWYELARAKMASGLTRLKADKRVEELTETRQRRAADRQRYHPGENASQDLWNGLF